MTAPGESLEARLAAVLAEHRLRPLGLATSCRCERWLLLDGEMSHGRHVALALAAVVAADVEQAAADRAAVLRDAARDLEGRLGTEGAPRNLWEFREWLYARAALEGPPS